MSKRKEILGQTWLYSLGTQIAQLITLLAALFSRRFLGPTQTGIWTTLQIIVDYSKYSTLGTMDAVSREIPYQIGKGEFETAEKIKNLAASFVFSGSIVLSLSISVFAFLTRGRFAAEITYGLYFVAVVIFLQRINNLQIALLRCYKRFDVETVFMIASAAVNAVLVGVLTYFFKIYGFIFALILSLVFNILFVRTRYAFKFKWNYDLKTLKPLVSFGLPLMVLGLATTFFRSLDRIMIAKFLGFKMLGWYSIALMVTSYISNFPIAIGIVLLPHFQEKYGEKDSSHDLGNYLTKSAFAVALVMPLLLAFVDLAAPYGVSLFLPKFTPGLTAMKILILNMFFISLVPLYYDALITIKKHLLLFPIIFVSALLTAGLDWFAIQRGMGIEGVAAATGIGFFVYFFTLQASAAKFFHYGKSFNKTLGFIFILFLYLTAFILAAEKIACSDFYSIKTISVKMLMFILFAVPLIFILNKQFNFISLIAGKFFRKPRPAPETLP